MNDALEVVERPAETALVRLPRLDVAAIKARVADIEQVINSLMVRNTHFGPPYPGADKDALLQPGAELLLEAFYLAPHPTVEEIPEGPPGHKRFKVTGHLSDYNGRNLGTFEAECSTLEPKYRYRNAGITCPECGFDGAVFKSKPRKGDPPPPREGLGWYCWQRKGGCGAQFGPGDERIAGQKPGRVEIEDPAENYHTCKSMAQKRWMVAITKRTLALSARFVDAEAAQSAPFDWKQAAPLLRAMPGERKEKWNRVILECLQQFGRPPEQCTALEGSVIIQQLAEQIQSPADLHPDDFMESPEFVNGKAPASVPEPEPPKGAEMPEPDRKEFMKDLRRRKMDGLAVALFGEPATWLESTKPKLANLLSLESKIGAAFGPPDGWAEHAEEIRGML